MMVDDFKLDEKHVNLYEPRLDQLERPPQPVEFVVNRIDNTRCRASLGTQVQEV